MSTSARFSCLIRYSSLEALVVMFSICAFHLRLSLIVTPRTLALCTAWTFGRCNFDVVFYAWSFGKVNLELFAFRCVLES